MIKKRYGILLVYCLFPLMSYGKSIIEKVKLSKQQETLYASVYTKIDFNQELDNAIKNGVVITFNYEFEIKKNNWYSFNALANLKKNYILSYHHITSEYRLENPITFQSVSFKSLNNAINAMEILNRFPLINTKQLPNEKLTLKVRFYLASENLPALMRLNKWISRDWNIDSDWTKWPIP